MDSAKRGPTTFYNLFFKNSTSSTDFKSINPSTQPYSDGFAVGREGHWWSPLINYKSWTHSPACLRHSSLCSSLLPFIMFSTSIENLSISSSDKHTYRHENPILPFPVTKRKIKRSQVTRGGLHETSARDESWTIFFYTNLISKEHTNGNRTDTSRSYGLHFTDLTRNLTLKTLKSKTMIRSMQATGGNLLSGLVLKSSRSRWMRLLMPDITLINQNR